MTLTAILGIFLVSAQIVSGSTPKKYGRDGNDHLKQEQYDEATSAYQEGLSSYQPSNQSDKIYHGLQNNLGLSLHRQENFEEASLAFDQALASAPNDDAVARAAFNAGNNAFTTQQLERALEFYQTALLSDPNDEDAKFNYEFVRRQLQEQDQEQDSDDNEEQEENQNEEQEDEQENNGDQDEQNQDQENNQGENSEENNQQQPGEEQQDTGDQNQQQVAPLTREQAERILEALENEEEELLREIQRVEARPRRVAKDW